MTNSEIEPVVPRMPRRTSTTTVRADGGRPRTRYERHDAEAPLVPRA
jgi:hypothetical protein